VFPAYRPQRIAICRKKREERERGAGSGDWCLRNEKCDGAAAAQMQTTFAMEKIKESGRDEREEI